MRKILRSESEIFIVIFLRLSHFQCPTAAMGLAAVVSGNGEG